MEPEETGSPEAQELDPFSDEALAQQIASAAEVAEEQTESQEEATPTEGRPRDEKGRFVSQEAEEEEPSLILGKFKSQDELAEAYRNLEQQQGRQGSEVGDLRRELQELRDSFGSQPEQEQSQYPLSNELVERIDELTEENPQRAAMWAIQHQPMLYDRVMQTWAETDPLSAMRFEQRLLMQQLQQDVQERLAPLGQTVQNEQRDRQFAQAWANVAQKFSDLDGQAIVKAAESAPELALALQKGDAPTKQRMIENLYWLAKGQQADTLKDAAKNAAEQDAVEAVEQKVAATVVSASSTNAAPEGKAKIEQYLRETFLSPSAADISEGLG